MSEYINKELCKECGGSCCKKNGCMYLPEDFESMEYDYLLNKIKEGNISICLNFITIHGTLELYKEVKESNSGSASKETRRRQPVSSCEST